MEGLARPSRLAIEPEPELPSTSIVEILQCPICYELPTAPIFGCPNGHIVCSSCRDQIPHCGICRSEKFNVRNLLLEELLKRPILPCAYKEDGCEVGSMTGAQYTEHLKTCSYRPIECYCKVGEMECNGEIYSVSDYTDHMIEAHGLTSGQCAHVVKCNMNGPFTPAKFTYAGKDFILMSHRDDTRFWTWIAMPDSANDFYAKITLRYYFGREEKTISSDVFPPKNIRESAEDVLKSGHCLEFHADTAPLTMPPYVWPNSDDYEIEAPAYPWGYTVEITKPQYARKSSQMVHRPLRPIERNHQLMRFSGGNRSIHPHQGQFGIPTGVITANPLQPRIPLGRINPMGALGPMDAPNIIPPPNNLVDDFDDYDLSDESDEDEEPEVRGTVRPANQEGEVDDVAPGPKRIALDPDVVDLGGGGENTNDVDNNTLGDDEGIIDEDSDEESDEDLEYVPPEAC